MKRDMDLIRLLLLELEGIQEVDLSGYVDEQVKYHKYLLIDAGLAVGDAGWHRNEVLSAQIFRLTREGHDFLDAARSETIWKRATERISSSVGSVSFAVLKGLLVKIAKSQIQ